MSVRIPSWLEPTERHRAVRYGAAVLFVVLSTLTRFLLEEQLRSLVFFTYFPAVAVAGWFGGLGPGLLATLLSALAVDFFWMEPRGGFSFSGTGLVQIAFFVICGGFLSLLAEMLHQVVRRERGVREQLQVTLSSIGDGVIATDGTGVVTFLNPVASSLTGWSQAEALGKPLTQVFNIVNEQTRRTVENPLERVLREKRVVGLANHTILIARSGSEVPIEDSAAPIIQPNGELSGAVLVFQDATERRRADEARSRLASVIETSEDAIITETLDGIITSWNRGAERMYGYNAAEVIGKSVALLMPPDFKSQEEALLARIKRGERVDHYETVRLKKNGERVTVSLALAGLGNSDGQVIGAAKIARDITRAKKTEEALAARTRRLDLACAAAGLGVFDWDIRGDQAIWENEQMYRIFGLQPGNPVINKRQFEEEVIHPEDRAEFMGSLEAAIKECRPFQRSCRIRRRNDGALRVIQYSAQVECDEKGDPLRMVGVLADVTEQRAATENLERTVAERTAALRGTVAQLEEFSYSVSHDLRSPLRTMNGYATMLLEDFGEKLGAEGKSFLERIAAGAARMDRLTLDVLEYSRLSHEKGPTGPIALGPLVDGIIAEYPNFSENREKIQIERPLLNVLGRESLLTQAISNLIGNALKFARPGVPPRIRLWTEPANGVVRLFIEDNGIGIAPQHQQRIFNIFEKLHPSSSSSGTGIGLAIVRRAIEQCGGRVGVQSDGQSGSRFWIELPAA